MRILYNMYLPYSFSSPASSQSPHTSTHPTSFSLSLFRSASLSERNMKSPMWSPACDDQLLLGTGAAWNVINIHMNNCPLKTCSRKQMLIVPGYGRDFFPSSPPPFLDSVGQEPVTNLCKWSQSLMSYMGLSSCIWKRCFHEIIHNLWFFTIFLPSCAFHIEYWVLWVPAYNKHPI